MSRRRPNGSGAKITARLLEGGGIAIEVDGIATGDEVKRAFVEARRSLWGIGAPTEYRKHVLLVDFVLVRRRTGKHLGNPTWRQVLDEWNERYPDWRYASWESMRVGYDNAMRRLQRQGPL